MAKDYKRRLQSPEHRFRKKKSSPLGLIKSMVITAVIMTAVVFILLAIKSQLKKSNPSSADLHASQLKTPSADNNAKLASQQPSRPQFDFYTILPARDIVIADFEIKSRAREEALGNHEAKQYLMQAGSFKNSAQAEQLSAKLAAMGIESSIQKTKVGTVMWYRVKLGPYAQMSSVSTLRTRLRQNGIDVVVTEMNH